MATIDCTSVHAARANAFTHSTSLKTCTHCLQKIEEVFFTLVEMLACTTP
jgi:hypothetical protein